MTRATTTTTGQVIQEAGVLGAATVRPSRVPACAPHADATVVRAAGGTTAGGATLLVPPRTWAVWAWWVWPRPRSGGSLAASWRTSTWRCTRWCLGRRQSCTASSPCRLRLPRFLLGLVRRLRCIWRHLEADTPAPTAKGKEAWFDGACGAPGALSIDDAPPPGFRRPASSDRPGAGEPLRFPCSPLNDHGRLASMQRLPWRHSSGLAPAG